MHFPTVPAEPATRRVGATLDPQVLVKDLQDLVEELHPHRRGHVVVTMDSSLDRDLGLDSLARMELLARVERTYGVSLPESAVANADTPRDLLRALAAADSYVEAPEVPETSLREQGEGQAAPDTTRTLVEVLQWHVQQHPDRVHVHLLDEHGAVEPLTYGDLLAGARAVAAGLKLAEVAPGEAVAIMLPTQLDYFSSFFGILLAGGIPVPIYPPARLTQIEDHFLRHARILANAGVRQLITFEQASQVARLLGAQVECLRGVTTVAELSTRDAAGGGPRVTERDLAFLQYTSGSTGNPKGVVLTHDNVLASLRSMAIALDVRPDDVFVSWLPLYHDMGLIGAWMGSLYYGIPLVLMSPLAFLRRPERWLQTIHAHRGTMSGGPNFAYELCLRRIRDEDIEGLDLSSWRVAFNGAEPVSPETLAGFARRFSPHGLGPNVLTPVYGLAEATLGVAFTPIGRGPRLDRVSREVMTREGRATPAESDDTDPLTFVSSGVPIPGFEVRTVDDTGHETSEREEGRLEFRGPSTTSGYFRNAEETRTLFHDDWLDSGDLAYVAEGEVYITGRAKDVIIRGGRNIYPYELEEAVGNVAGVRRGCVAAFGGGDPDSGTERLVVVAETRESESSAQAKLRAEIESLTVELLGMPADEVVMAPPHTVLKTSSGKIRRAAMRELHERGELAPSGRAVWMQLLRLTWAGLAPQLRRARRAVNEFAFAAYFWAVFAPLTCVAWTAVWLVPTVPRRWRLLRRLARALWRATGTPLAVEGLEHVPPSSSFVMVANHASYLDGLVLVATLPRPVRFVVKRELEANWLAGRFLERIGCLFVERFDRARSATDARTVTEALKAGEALGVFPEGTLHRMPGLLPFQLGAFMAAVDADAPVLAVVLRGTRSMLRNESWYPRRGAVRVQFVPPPSPGQGGADREERWSAAIGLRDQVRAEMLARCGEPDLADRQPLLDLADRAERTTGGS